MKRLPLERPSIRECATNAMSASREPEPDSINAQLADFLCARREEMIRTWIGRLHADTAFADEELTLNQLRDHLPRLFDDLAELLRCYGSEGAVRRTSRDAEKHGAERWQQGFTLAALLREIMHLRAVFIYHLRVFEESHAEFGTAARLFAHTTVHQFLDQIAIDATAEFVAAETHARREAARLGL